MQCDSNRAINAFQRCPKLNASQREDVVGETLRANPWHSADDSFPPSSTVPTQHTIRGWQSSTDLLFSLGICVVSYDIIFMYSRSLRTRAVRPNGGAGVQFHDTISG